MNKNLTLLSIMFHLIGVLICLLMSVAFGYGQDSELDVIQEQLNNPGEIERFSGKEADVLEIIEQVDFTGNIANISQGNQNRLEVNQVSFPTVNDLVVVQGSFNTSVFTQSVLATGGMNLAEILQGDNNTIRLFQESQQSNSAMISQQGDGNIFVGSDPEDATINPTKNAVQSTVEGSNSLRLLQDGDHNSVGLTQEGFGDNIADITQLGSGNQFGIYQKSLIQGFENRIEITQEGGTVRNFETSHVPDGGGVLDFTGIPSLISTP